jgi:hypothetical protein
MHSIAVLKNCPEHSASPTEVISILNFGSHSGVSIHVSISVAIYVA